MLTQEVFREEPLFTEFAFNRLLEWLDDGVASNGERYLEMRRRLVSYFERRNRPTADELADETFNRIARTLEEDGVIMTRPPARYCYVVARFVLLEDIRRERRHLPIDESWLPDSSGSPLACQAREDRERRLDCLDRCLQELRPDQRGLVVEYYRDSRRQKIERRRDLAARLGISMNALGIRVCRIREMLTACMERWRVGPRRIDRRLSYRGGRLRTAQ